MSIPYGRHSIDDEDIREVVSVLKSEWLTQGPTVPFFEKKICQYVASSYCVLVNSATSALHIACLALDVSVGDYVWTSANTFVASANCALYCGAEVDFVDIDSDTLNLSVSNLEEKLRQAEKTGTLPKVVIAVHFAGQPAEMSEIKRLSEVYGFFIIEDASHSLGANYKNQKVGSCQYSDITIFSFHPVKMITSGEGGAAVTNSSELGRKMRLLREHGIDRSSSSVSMTPKEEIWNYAQVTLGFNYRMPDINAALGVSQLRRIDDFVSRRRNIAKTYDDFFSNLPVKPQAQSPDSLSSYHLYVANVGDRQKSIMSFLQERKVLVNLHYVPVYLHPYYRQKGFRRGYCPNAEMHFRQSLSFPIFYKLSDRDLECVMGLIRTFYV